MTKWIKNGITYDTDTSERIAGFEPDEEALMRWGGGPFGDLYQNKHGAFFLVGGNWEDEAEVYPMTEAEALAFVERHADAVQVEKYFGPQPEAGAAESRLSIRLPINLANRIEKIAKAKGLTLDAYARQCFERCATQDGEPLATNM
jgi:hypothetical protein